MVRCVTRKHLAAISVLGLILTLASGCGEGAVNNAASEEHAVNQGNARQQNQASLKSQKKGAIPKAALPKSPAATPPSGP